MHRTTDQLLQRIHELREDLLDYLDSRLQLFGLKLIESGSRSVSQWVQKVTSAIFMILAFVFLMTGLSLVLGEWLGSQGLGFLLMTLPFLFISLYFRHRPSKIIQKRVEEEMYKSFFSAVDAKKKKSSDHAK